MVHGGLSASLVESEANRVIQVEGGGGPDMGIVRSIPVMRIGRTTIITYHRHESLPATEESHNDSWQRNFPVKIGNEILQ